MFPLTPHRRISIPAVACIALLAACNADKRSSPILTGTVAITVTPPADGLSPSIVVSGPNAYSKTITASATLTKLPVGDYGVQADSLMAADSVVGTFVDSSHVTGAPAAVAAGESASVAVSFGRKRQIGGLWMANNVNATVSEFAAAQMHKSDTLAVQAETLATTLSEPTGVAIDAHGNMWLSDGQNGALVMYSAAARNAGGATAPTATVVDTALNFAEQIAFDAQGNLWVANNGTGTILGYTAAQLAAADTETAAVRITLTGGAAPWSLAFDKSGNLWVADNVNNSLVEYTPSQLGASGAPTPADTIGSNSGSLDTPGGLAFDASGDLWVANGSGSTVVEYTPTQLAANGSPAPHVVITLPSGVVPGGLAFDHSGTLWVTDNPLASNGAIYGLSSAQLAATGSPTPKVALTGLSSFSPEQVAFDTLATAPPPSASRLRRPRASASHAGRINKNVARFLHRKVS